MRSCARSRTWISRSASDASRPCSARSAMSSPSHQPASVGRSCVLAVASASAGYASGRLELARRVALEDQHAVRQDGVLGQRRAQRVGNGPEILADHEAAVTVALERKQAEEIVERIVRRRRRRPAARPRGPRTAARVPSRDRCAARRRCACWRATWRGRARRPHRAAGRESSAAVPSPARSC